MNIKKILKIIVIIILVILVILLIHTIRNFIIVRGLQENIAKYKDSTNYHIRLLTKENNGIEMTANQYVKDGKHVTFVERNLNGEIAKISVFGENDKKGFNTYIENGESKIAQIETEGVSMSMYIYNGVENDSTWHTFLASFFANIRSEKVNGKECYIVNNYPSAVNLTSLGKNEYYIERDTGLMIKSITNEQTSEREYEFDNVDDNIFIEPDISQYTLKVNS